MDLEEYVRLGKECGLEGKELLDFAVTQRDSALLAKRTEADSAREERRLNREAEQMKLEEITKQKELDLKISESKPDNGAPVGGFTSKIPCMPAFRADTDELDAYIERFERHAILSKWPGECWAAALGNLLTGPALDVYASMRAQDASDYNLLKRMLLRHFALTSEGNWKRFRDAKKRRDESYYQYAARLTSYVTRSIELSGNAATFDALLDLLVREHIYETCDCSLSTFLRERSPENVSELVVLAEKYSIAHVSSAKDQSRHARGKEKAHQAQSEKSTGSVRDKQLCFVCGKAGHFAWKCPDRKGGPLKPAARGRTDSRKPPVNACIVGVCPEGTASDIKHSVDPEVETAKLACGHEIPMLYAGCTMGTQMPECVGELYGKKVVALRDTGCSSVVVRSELVSGAQFTGETQMCLLIDGTIRKVPVAEIQVCSPYFTGKVRALCMDNPLYDLIIGNIPGAKVPGNVQLRMDAPVIEDGHAKSEEGVPLLEDCLDDVTRVPVDGVEPSTSTAGETQTPLVNEETPDVKRESGDVIHDLADDPDDVDESNQGDSRRDVDDRTCSAWSKCRDERDEEA